MVIPFLLQIYDSIAALKMTMRELYRPVVLHRLSPIGGVAFQEGGEVVPDKSETPIHAQVQSDAALKHYHEFSL